MRRFSGFKFVPPGLHLLTWSTGSQGSSSGPAAIPIRHGLIKILKAKQRVVLTYDSETETVHQREEIISDDSLRTLDKELAPYPFEELEKWKALTSHINERNLDEVVPEGRVDGMMPVIGEESEKGESELGGEVDRGADGLHFVQFRLKRSWRDGAVGQEVTRYARDKSWLLGDVVTNRLERGESGSIVHLQAKLISDPYRLLGQLQLAFILLLQLSSYGGLTVYKRILSLFTRSSSILSTPAHYMPEGPDISGLFRAVVVAIAAQIQSIPSGSFETELPEFDLFYLDEIESLRENLSSTPWRDQVSASWKRLQSAGKTWRWDIDNLDSPGPVDGSDEEDEEGEYAPVVVDL